MGLLLVLSGKVQPSSTFCRKMLTIGRDPRFFFDGVGESTLNAEAASYIPAVDVSSSDPNDIVYPLGQNYSDPSSHNAPFANNDDGGWSLSPANAGNDVTLLRIVPSQGVWGVIPSRAVMISNLPKTTQLWTLVELLKVSNTSPPPKSPFPSITSSPVSLSLIDGFC